MPVQAASNEGYEMRQVPLMEAFAIATALMGIATLVLLVIRDPQKGRGAKTPEEERRLRERSLALRDAAAIAAILMGLSAALCLACVGLYFHNNIPAIGLGFTGVGWSTMGLLSRVRDMREKQRIEKDEPELD